MSKKIEVLSSTPELKLKIDSKSIDDAADRLESAVKDLAEHVGYLESLFKKGLDGITATETITEPDKQETIDYEETSYTLEDIKEIGFKMVKANLKTELRDLLTQFEASRVGELKEEDYKGFYNKAKEVLELVSDGTN